MKKQENTIRLYDLNKRKFCDFEFKRLVPIGNPGIFSLGCTCPSTETNPYGVHHASLEEILVALITAKEHGGKLGEGYVTLTIDGINYAIPNKALEKDVELIGIGDIKLTGGNPVIPFQAYKIH